MIMINNDLFEIELRRLHVLFPNQMYNLKEQLIDIGRKSSIMNEITFLKSKSIKELVHDADIGACHKDCEAIVNRINELKRYLRSNASDNHVIKISGKTNPFDSYVYGVSQGRKDERETVFVEINDMFVTEDRRKVLKWRDWQNYIKKKGDRYN